MVDSKFATPFSSHNFYLSNFLRHYFYSSITYHSFLSTSNLVVFRSYFMTANYMYAPQVVSDTQGLYTQNKAISAQTTNAIAMLATQIKSTFSKIYINARHQDQSPFPNPYPPKKFVPAFGPASTPVRPSLPYN